MFRKANLNLEKFSAKFQMGNQCSWSKTFWGGSGSGSSDPCFWLMDPDPEPGSGSCYFRHWPSRWQQNTIFSAYYFLKVHLHHFSKIKSQKESQNIRNQGFSYYFWMMIEGSGSGTGAGPGPIPLTSGSGSGSGRPKNMWIRWIRLRIRNTVGNWSIVYKEVLHLFPWYDHKHC